MIKIKNEKCLMGGCDGWLIQRAEMKDADWEYADCERCGFDVEEDAWRGLIPLTLRPDGLMGKVIPAKPRRRRHTSGNEND